MLQRLPRQIAQLKERDLAARPEIAARFAAVDAAMLGDTAIDGLPRVRKRLLCHRAASSTARVDKASIAARPCFLCEANRPPEQPFIPWGAYQLLVNPFPLSPSHYTFVLAGHTPQLLTPERVADLVAFAGELPGMCIFYNGPKCGASAPDHFHFQAIDADPGTNIFIPRESLEPVKALGGAEILAARPPQAAFPFFIIEADGAKSAGEALEHLLKALPAADPEPAINVAATYLPAEAKYRIFIAPRAAHRPRCYSDPDAPLLVSPASIEMLGILGTFRETDFERLDTATARQIYADVALSPDVFQSVIDRL